MKEKMTAEALLAELTLQEKVALLAGHNFMETNAIPRLNIPAIRMSDGPHGLRVQTEGGDNGVTASLPATSFPTASCSANSWNPDLLRKMGNAIAEEAHFYGVNVVLGPGVNIKRNPLCGRNFEYFSEDPFLAGCLGAAEVIGLQEGGVGVSVKHFALNNAENFRFVGDSIVDERAMREIYLRQFEYIVKVAKPETLMCAYNKLNGFHCSENKWLLKEVLRDEWGFDGLVMSDWGTTHDRVLGVKSGLDLEMPGDNAICRKWIVDAIDNEMLDAKELEDCVCNVLNLVLKHCNDKKAIDANWDAHHSLAKEIATEGAVLLKNDGALPLDEKEDLLIIGELFEKMRYQGSGSSMINPCHLVSPKDAFDKNAAKYTYFKGYCANSTQIDERLLEEAKHASKGHRKALLFLGLTDLVESEGSDRDTMALPENQLALVEALLEEKMEIVIALYGGSVVELPFFDKVSAVLDLFLPGQNGGEVTYDLLFGKANPSGRLAETWPLSYSDVLFGEEYSKTPQEIYKESIYVGYRYYLTKGVPVRFPFGYGLSYTQFDYKDLNVKENGEGLEATISLTNVGDRPGKEVVQVYVASPRENTHKPIRELKGFKKVELLPKESKIITIRIGKDDLKYWDTKEKRFVLEEGEYDIQIAKNAAEVALNSKICLKGEKIDNPEKETQKAYHTLEIESLTNEEYTRLTGVVIEPLRPKKPIALDSFLSDLNVSFLGRILLNAVLGVVRKQEKEAKKLPEGSEKDNRLKGAKFLERVLLTNSLMTLSMSSSGAFPYNVACGFRDFANGHFLKGIKNFLTKIKAPKLPVEEKEK